MSTELRIPEVGESIQEVQIGRWLKQEGDAVEQDEEVVELETDKASLELPAPAAGILAEITKQAGETVSVGDVIGRIEESDGTPTAPQRSDKQQSQKHKTDEKKADESRSEESDAPQEREQDEADESADQQRQADQERSREQPARRERSEPERGVPATPSAKRALRQHGLTADEVEPAGERLRPEDVERHVRQQAEDRQTDPQEQKRRGQTARERPAEKEGRAERGTDSELEEAVPMSLIRRRIAARLVEAQQQAALVTTFNEIEMSEVIELRQTYREKFVEEYDVDLGYMPFFVKAAIDALRHFPELNAEIRDDQIIYRNYYHMGIAIGAEKGLVVPILRFAERMSFAEIEEAIGDFARRAGANKLEPTELEGGTFTITNGGVYGSLLSTPLVNPPQSGVLGMHAIEDRPVARQGEVVIRPMMYVALTYDHRLVDGRGAVLFLRRIKETIEEPARMLIEV